MLEAAITYLDNSSLVIVNDDHYLLGTTLNVLGSESLVVFLIHHREVL